VKRFLLIVLSLLLVGGGIGVYLTLWAPNTFENDRFIMVSKGETFLQVVSSLENAGILRSRLLFDAAGRWLDLTTKMQIGKYRFKSGMSNKEILEDLREGKTVELIGVTVPEGFRAVRQARLLAKNLGIDSARFMALVEDTALARRLHIPASTFEGYLMPSTYKFYWQTDEAEIVTAMVNEFWQVFNDSLRLAAETRGKSIHEILTLASIVEMETAVDSERAIIAGVYNNRLRKNMKLEADPTVQYVLEDGPRRLYYSDLQRESAYNTYLHRGLPPGPINNPGRSSIYAALFPARNKYLFFVASGEGGHTFSKTYQEHLKAVRHLKKIRAEKEAAKEEG